MGSARSARRKSLRTRRRTNGRRHRVFPSRWRPLRAACDKGRCGNGFPRPAPCRATKGSVGRELGQRTLWSTWPTVATSQVRIAGTDLHDAVDRMHDLDLVEPRFRLHEKDRARPQLPYVDPRFSRGGSRVQHVHLSAVRPRCLSTTPRPGRDPRTRRPPEAAGRQCRRPAAARPGD